MDGVMHPASGQIGQVTQDRIRLVAEFSTVLEQIRSLEGFASFGLPPTTDELLAEGSLGPVVTFNIADYRSDALVLASDGVSSVALPGLTRNGLADQISVFLQALHDTTDPRADRKAAEAALTGSWSGCGIPRRDPS
jgi:hypothetical protein